MTLPFIAYAPQTARESCYGCPAHDFVHKTPASSCGLGRGQVYWISASKNLVLRPTWKICKYQSFIDEMEAVKTAARGDGLVTRHLFPTYGTNDTGTEEKPLSTDGHEVAVHAGTQSS